MASLFRNLAEAWNSHVDAVSRLHRLRFTAKFEGVQYFVCTCGDDRYDRTSFNDHLNEVMKVAALS